MAVFTSVYLKQIIIIKETNNTVFLCNRITSKTAFLVLFRYVVTQLLCYKVFTLLLTHIVLMHDIKNLLLLLFVLVVNERNANELSVNDYWDWYILTRFAKNITYMLHISVAECFGRKNLYLNFLYCYTIVFSTNNV